jgi:hypothetical protein
MIRIDSRLRYLARGSKWPAHWQDYRVITGQSTTARHRVDFLGVAGIGKTTFIKDFALALGERVPRCDQKTPLTDDWAVAFNEIYDKHFLLSQTEDPSWSSKHRRTGHLTDVIELEHTILRCGGDQLVINGVGILRHRLSYFSKQAATRPEFIQSLLSDRVVVLCVSDDPVARSIRGKKKRGDRDADRDGLGETVAYRVEKIQAAVDVLKSLGIPVLELNLDQPRPAAIAQAAKFLHEAGMDSTLIRRHAAKAQ